MVAIFTHVVLEEPLSEAGAAFWAGALDGTWRSAGPGPDRAASLVPADGDAYVHRSVPGQDVPVLVLEVEDVAATARRIRALGGTADPADEDRWRSPGGLRFALHPSQERRQAIPVRWPDGTTSRLVQLCLDCPPTLAEEEARFWAEVTGWTWRGCTGLELVCHLVPAHGPPQLLVQRRDSASPVEVTLHLDLGASDREAEAARLVALVRHGSRREAAGSCWRTRTGADPARRAAALGARGERRGAPLTSGHSTGPGPRVESARLRPGRSSGRIPGALLRRCAAPRHGGRRGSWASCPGRGP